MSQKNEDREKIELEMIRMKKMRTLMEAKQRQTEAKERVVSVSDKLDYLLKVVLSPEAYAHLNMLKSSDPNVYQWIYNQLINEEVVQSADYLISIVSQRGGVERRIPEDVIIMLERKAKGIKGSVQVKRGGGEMMDLGSFLGK